ncbi:uncharacterized protein LOC119720101 [Patiria miniata]|uniref:Uncharacterized protein n=1 Tax=Patiria miniata TaxID=46514 RepID=A0A913Z163_PATMI|nr:uncharacterized protein LOC119720101 [Patiria miniata]
MTSIGNATPLVCLVVLILALLVPPAAQQGGASPPINCPQNTVSVGVLIAACVAVLVGTLIFEGLAILCYRRYCKDREKPQKVAHRFMISPDQELVVKENLGYESDSDAQERSLREAKEKKRASIFNISETKDNMMYVPALYRNPITKDRDTGSAIMNGYHDYEPDYGMDTMFTYNAGWGSRVPNILSGKGNTNSLESLYTDADEYPILHTPHGVGPVNFASSKFRDGFGRKSIDIHEDDGDVTTYTYTTGFGGKVRREVATVTSETGDDIEIEGDRVTWRKCKLPDEVVLDMDEEEAKPETRIAIDDNFTIGKPTSTRRQEYTTAEVHSDSQGTSYDPSGNFILRATPSTSRSDSSDDDLYDYGDSIERQQQTLNMPKHSPGTIGHGTFRATVGGIPLDHGSSEEESPTELFNSRYRYSTGLNKAKLVAMRAAAAAHAREGILNEEDPPEDQGQDGMPPVMGYIKLVKPDDSSQDGSSEEQQYHVMPRRDSDSPNSVRLYPVNSRGKPISIQTQLPGGFSRDSYIRHRQETYIEVSDAGVQCEIIPRGGRPGQEKTSILRKERTSYDQEMNSVDDIPTIGVIRLMHPKSSKHVRIREDQTDYSTMTFSEEDLTSASLEDVSYRSTSRSNERMSPRPRRARSAPARSERAPMTEDDQRPFEEVPTIGVIRLVRPDSASDTSGVDSEVTSGEESVPGDRFHGPRNDKWTQHEVPIVRLAQQILQESVNERGSSQRSLHRLDQDMGDIPTIGVVRLVRPKSTTHDVRPMTSSRVDERFDESEETNRQTSSRVTPVSDMPTIGVIKLLQQESRREPTSRFPVSVIDRGTQPINTWAQLLREMHSMVESEILRKMSKKQHDQPTDETDALPRTISVIKLKREEVQVQPQVPYSLMDQSTQSSAEMRDEATMPTFGWSHLIHEVEDQIEERYKRMSAPAPKEEFQATKSVQKLGVIQLKTAPEKIIRDSFTQVSGPDTYEKSTGPAWSFKELVEEVEEEAVQKFKKTLKQLDRSAEPQDFHEPVRSVSVIKLKKEPGQEKLVRDSVTQISGPNTYEKSTGSTLTFAEIKEEIEEEAVREFKRTLSQLDRPAVVSQDGPQPVRSVSVIKLQKEPEAEKPTVTSRGVQPDLPWRELKEEIEDEAIEEYKKQMRRFQPKEAVQQVPETQAPTVSVIKLKGPKTKPAPEKWDNITQCDLIEPKPVMADQVTEPARPWSDVLHNVRRILENEYRRTITELETRLTSLPKDQPIVETVPTVAVFKLKGPDVHVQPEPEKPKMMNEKTQAAPRTSEQETAPERPWKNILTDVRKILENEYRRTIRELEDQLSGRDEPDSGKTMAYFKLSAPEVPKVQTVSMYTQIDAPQTGDQGTLPERPWGDLIQDVRSSVENEYRVTIRELESQLAERPKDVTKEPTRLGIFKLKGPKQQKVKKPVLHDTFTQPAKPWLTLMSEMEENVERRLSMKKIKPVAVEPEIVQQTQQVVEMTPQIKPTTADVMTQASQPATSSKASQSVSVQRSSMSTEANIQPNVTERSTSCDLLRPGISEQVQVKPMTAIKSTVTEVTKSSDFFQLFKPEFSMQETQASPSKTSTATMPQKSLLQEVGIQTRPSTEDLEVITDLVSTSDLSIQVEMQSTPEIPIITPTIMQPVHAPVTFKEPDVEKIDFAVQVVPEKTSRASATELRKYVDNFVQVASPKPTQEVFGAQVQPDVTDGHSSIVIEMKDVGTDNLQVHSTEKSTEISIVKELLDLAVQVKPEVKSRVAATDKKKYSDVSSQADDAPIEEMADTLDSSIQAVPNINVSFTSMDTPKSTDAFTQLKPLVIQQGDKSIQVNANMAEVGTETPVVSYVDNSSQMNISTLSQHVQARTLQADATTGKELLTNEISTQPDIATKQEVSVQVSMEIETEPAIIKAVVQSEQYSMPTLPTPAEVTDFAMQTMSQTAEFSNQYVPQTTDKYTEKKMDGHSFALQVSQNSTDSSTETMEVVQKTVPVQVRPRTVDKATEYSESKPDGIDIGIQYSIDSNEIGVSAEPQVIDDGTLMEIKLQLDVGTQADCEITVEPAIIQEVIKAPEESVALMNWDVETSDADTQTIQGETTQRGTSPDGIKTADAVVQHVQLRNIKDGSVQADPDVTTTGTLAFTVDHIVHATQVKPQTIDRGMTTVIRGSVERSNMANLLPKAYVKPPSKDVSVQMQPVSNLKTQSTLTDKTEMKSMPVQASPATSTHGQTSRPDVIEQWSMTDEAPEKEVIELIIPQIEKPVEAPIPILKAELLDKTTQVILPSTNDMFSSIEISQTQTATQYDHDNDEMSTQTDVEAEPELTSSSTQMDVHVVDTTAQTIPVKRETIGLSTDVTQFRASFTQYEPEQFKSSASNQTSVNTCSTGFSPEKIVLKSTGISPEKRDVTTSSTQYQKSVTEDSSMQTEEQEELEIIEEIVSLEKIETLESAPIFPEVELTNTDTQTEREVLPIMSDVGSQHEVGIKTSVVQTIQVKLESKAMSTTGPQLRESVVQYEPERFRTAVSSQTTVPTRTTGSSTEKASFKTTGVSPVKVDVKASSTQYQIAVLQDNSMQTEDQEEPISIEEFITVERAPVVEFMPEYPAVELADAETQAELVTTDRAILTDPETHIVMKSSDVQTVKLQLKSKFTSTFGPQLKESVVQYEPERFRMAASSQTTVPTRTTGSSTEKAYFKTTGVSPDKVNVNSSSTQYQMTITQDNSMQTEEKEEPIPLEELVTVEQAPVVEFMPEYPAVELADAETQAELVTTDKAILTDPEIHKVMKSSDVQTAKLQLESKFTSTFGPQLKESVVQYEPERFRMAASSQTTVPTRTTGSSTEKASFKTTGVSPDKVNVKASSTQYQMTITQDNSMQTEEKEEPIPLEELVTVEQAPVVEFMPEYPAVELADAETQAELVTTDRAILTDPETHKVMKSSDVQTAKLQLESKFTSTFGPQLKESVVQYEPERFRMAASSQTTVPTRTTGSSTEKASFKTTGVSPDKVNVKASSTQYQMTITQDNSMQTEEKEEPIPLEELVTVEQAPVVEFMPEYPAVELADAETQAELVTTDRAILTDPETHKVMKSSDVQTAKLQLESKFTSTFGPQLKESVVQYEPERFRMAASSQTTVPTRTTGSSTEKASFKTTGVSPDKVNVKASSTQYQITITQDNSMQTEEKEEPIPLEELVTVEQAPVVEFMPDFPPVELVDAETQAEPVTTDRAILTRPESREKTTSTFVKKYTQAYVQNVPRMTSVSQQMTMQRPQLVSQGTTMVKIQLTSIPTQAQPSTRAFGQMMEPMVNDHWSMTDEEPVEEMIASQVATVVESMPELPVETQDADVQVEPKTSNIAIETYPETAEQGSLVQPETREVPSQMSIHQATVSAQATVKHSTMSSQTDQEEKKRLKNSGVQTQQYLVTSSSYVPLKEKSYKSVEHMGDLVGIQPRGPIKTQHKNLQASVSTATMMSQSTGPEQTATGFQTEEMIEVTDMEVQTNPVTIIDFVPVLKDSTVQYEPMYFYSASTQAEIPTMHQHVSAVVQNRNQETTTHIIKVQPSSSQTEAHQGEDNSSQTDAMSEPEPLIAPMKIEPVLFAPPALLPETQVAESQTDNVVSTDQSTSIKLPKLLHTYAQVGPRMQDTNTMTPVKQYAPVAVQNEPEMLSQMMQTSPDVREGMTLTEKPDITDQASQHDTASMHISSQAAPESYDASTSFDLVVQELIEAGTQHIIELRNFETQTHTDKRDQASFVDIQMQESDCQTELTIEDLEEMLATLKQKLDEKPMVQEFIIPEQLNPVESPMSFPIDTEDSGIQTFLETVQRSTSPILLEVKHAITQYEAELKEFGVQVKPDVIDKEIETFIVKVHDAAIQYASLYGKDKPTQFSPDVNDAESLTDQKEYQHSYTNTKSISLSSKTMQANPQNMDKATTPTLQQYDKRATQTSAAETVTRGTQREYAPVAEQNEPEMLSQMMQTSPDVREGMTLTEKPDITDQASQHDTASMHVSSQAAPESYDASTSFDLVVQELIEAGTQHIIELRNFETQTHTDKRDQASFVDIQMQESDCQTELTIEDLEEMLATLKQKLDGKPMVQEFIIPEQLNPVESPMSFPIDTEDSGVQTFLETVQRSTSPILLEVKHAITQYEAELKEFGVQVKPDVIDKEMETFIVKVHDAAIQYASLYGKDKPTQFSPDVNDAGSLTDQKEYQHSYTNTKSISLSSKTMQANPQNMDKATTPTLQQYDKRATQTSAAEMVTRWTQREILWADAPIQVRPVLDDATSQTDTIIKEDIAAILKPIEKKEVRLEMKSFKETNTVEIQTDPVIIKSARPDDDDESWLDSGIDTDVQTDPVVILSDLDSEIELMDEDSQTCPIDMIDADIQVETRKEVNDTTSQTSPQPQVDKTVQTMPKQISYASTVTTTPMVRPISSQTFPTKTATKGFQFEPVPYLTNEDIDTQTPGTLTKEQGTHALESQVETSTTQTDEMPVIEPEIIHVANLQPVEAQMTFSAPEAEVIDTGVQASTEVTDEDSQTTRVFTTDRPSSPGISYAVAESQTVSPAHRTKDTQYEPNAAQKKTQTEATVTVSMGTATYQVISQDICLQTFLETKPEIVDRSMQHAAVVFTGYSQTEETQHQHEETQTDQVDEEIQFITPSPEFLEAFTQTTDKRSNAGAQTEGLHVVESGTNAPLTKKQVGVTQTLRTSTWSEGTVTEPLKSVSMAVQTDAIPVRVVDEHISPVHLQPVHAPLKLPEYKPELKDASIQADVKTNERSMQHESENTQFNIFSTRVVKGEVKPTVLSEFSMTPQKKHFISHLESSAYPKEETLTYKHFVHAHTQVKPEVDEVPVQVQPLQDDRSTATEEQIFTSTEVQTEFAEEPMKEVIRVSQVPLQQTPFLDLGPILMDSGVQVKPKTTDHGMSPIELERGPMLLDTAAQHEIYSENAFSQTFTYQQEKSTYTSIDVRQESSQATTEKKDSGVQAKTPKHFVHARTQVKPDVDDIPVQVQPIQDDQSTATEEIIFTSIEVQTEFAEEPMEEVIRISHVPEQQTPFLDLGPILIDTGTQVEPKTSDQGMSAVDPGPVLLDATAQHEIYLEHAVSQTFIDQQEKSTYTTVNVRQESSQATTEKRDAGVQAKTEREVSLMTSGIQTVVIHEEKPQMIDMAMQFRPLNTDQATLTSIVATTSSLSNTEPVNMRQAMVQVGIKPDTESRATLTTPKYVRNITTQAETKCYDACVQHDDLPDLADKGLQIKPVMVDDTSETVQSRHVDRPTQVDMDGMKPETTDVSIQHGEEKDMRDKISQVKPISTEAGVLTEVFTKDKGNQANFAPEVYEIIRPDVTELQHAPVPFPEVMTTDKSIQHQPSVDIQTVQTSIDVSERASSPVGPDYSDVSSQTRTDASNIGLQTNFQETSTAEVQAVMSYFSEESYKMESVEEDLISAQVVTEEQHIAPLPTVQYQDAEMQYNPTTEDSTTETVSTGIDFANQSQPLTIEQGTTTDITKHSQAEVQVDIGNSSVITHETAVQHERMFKPVDVFTQAHPLTVEEGTSTMPLKKTEVSVQYIAPSDKRPSSPRIVTQTSDKGTLAQYVTSQSSTQTILFKSDVGIQSKPNTKSELTHAAIKPDSHDQSTATKPDVRVFETQTFFPKKSEGSQCDQTTLVHNTSQYERMFVEDNSVQVKPVIREQANSPIFKRKEVDNASSQTDTLPEDMDSSIEDLIRSAPHQPFKPQADSDFMHDYSDRLCEYLDRDEQMPVHVEHPIERIKELSQFVPRQENSSPIWDYAGDFSSRLYDTEMTESIDIIDRLFTSNQSTFELEEPIAKDETDQQLSAPKYYIESAVQTGPLRTKERSTSPLFPPTKEAQSQFDKDIGHTDTNVQASPITASESSYTAPVFSQDVSAQVDFDIEEVPTSDAATQHYTLGQDISAQVEPLMTDAGMTCKVDSTPTSTQAKPETLEQGTSTLKQSTPTSDMQTQAKPDAVAKTTSPLAIRKNQMAVQTKVDQRHIPTQYDRVSSADAVVQMSPQSLEKGTSTKPENRDVSIYVIPTQRHESTQYEQSIKTMDFMVQYRAQHLDISTQSIEFKATCLDRASSPINMTPEKILQDISPITESPIQPVMVQQVSASPTRLQPFSRVDDTELRQEIRNEIRMKVIHEIREEIREEVREEVRKNQMAVQTKVDQHYIPTQYDRVSSADKVVQMSPQSLEKGTSTKPQNRDVSIHVIPTQRHETTQYEQSIKTMDFMVQYRAQHLDISTQSIESKAACLDRASSPINMAPEKILQDTSPIAESPIKPVLVQQVSASPTRLQPFSPIDDTEVRQEIRNEIRMEVIREIREEIREEVRQEIWEEVREELLHEVQHEVNSRVEMEVRDELRTELEITVREELREEFIEEYKEEILIEIKEELKVEFESRIRLEFEERTRDDLEFKIRREIEPRVRSDLEPIIRRELEQEYIKETIHEVRTEAPVMYQPSEYKAEPVKPLMLDRGTSPVMKNLHDAPTQVSTVTKDRSSQYDKPSKPVDGITQTKVYTVECGTTPDNVRTSDAPVQAQPSMTHRGTTPSEKPSRESGIQVVVQKMDKCDQYEAKPSQSDVSVQFSHDPQTVGFLCQVQPDTDEQGTSMEVTKIHQTYVQTQNPLIRSENTQTVTDQMDATCQSEPVFHRDTTMQVKPVTFDKSTSTQPQETGDYSTQVELIEPYETTQKISVKQQDSSVQYERSMDVTDRRLQAKPVVREQANSPLSFLTFDIISPQRQDPVHAPFYTVQTRDAPNERAYITEIITGEKVPPAEQTLPMFTSPNTSAEPTSSKFSYSFNDRPGSTHQAKSPLEPLVARLDYVPMKSTDLDAIRPTVSRTSYRSSYESSYESSSRFTRDVLQSMPPRCGMILLQTTAAGTTYTSAFRTSTPTTRVSDPSTSLFSRTSILEQGKPVESTPPITSPILSDTESDSLPEMSELEKIRRDLRLSKVIVTDDQATLVGYFVNRDDEPQTPDLPNGSPFSPPEYAHQSSRFEYSSHSKFSHIPQSPHRGRQHFMNLEHTPTESIPNIIMDDEDFPTPTEEGDWFKRETSAYRLNVPYDKKGSPRPGARIVHSLSPSQSPSHTPGRMSPVFLSSEDGHPVELLPIPRGMVTRLSDLLSDGIPSDDESVLPMSRLSEMIEKHRELSQPPKWSPRSDLSTSTSQDPESEVDTTDSDSDTESFSAVMDFTDPFLHENPNFWRGGPTDFTTSSTNSDVSSDDDDVTVYGDCDVYSFDLPFFAPSKPSRSPQDASWMPGEPPRKRHSVIKIDRQRVREELSMSEVVLPDGPPRLTGYRINMDDGNWQRDRYSNRLSRSEPDLYRSTTSNTTVTSPPSYSTAYPYTKLGSSRRHPAPEQLMVDAGSMPALSAEIRYAKLVKKQEISHTQQSKYSRLSHSDPDLASWQEELFDVGHF